MENEANPKTTTKVWSENIEATVKAIAEKCQGYTWINMNAAKKLSHYHDVLMFILIVIAPLSGLLTLLDDSLITRNISAVISFIVGIISAGVKYSKFGWKITTYKNIASKYSQLENNIRRQLSLERDERVNAGSYLEWVSNTYDNLFDSTPILPNEIFERWVELAKTKDLKIPEKLDNKEVLEVKPIPEFTDSEMKYEISRLNRIV
jgi:hypothetical protein